jgi:Fic family protein
MSLKIIVNENILNKLREELLNRSSIERLPDSVWKRAGALNTWGTNAIEGNTLTWKEVEKILIEQRSVSNAPLPDVLETIKHEAAFHGLIRRVSASIRLTAVLELHEEVFRGVLADAGQWRRVNVRITGSRHTPPRMEKVLIKMEEWIEEYSNRDMIGEPVFPLAAWMHHSFEGIHPFSNGNGRIGRLLLNLHFLKHNWPPIHIFQSDREVYMNCLEEGHSGNLSRLIEFLRVSMGKSLLDLLDQVGTEDDELKPLKHFGSKGPYSAKYLTLRAGKEQLPAIKVKGEWQTSSRALRLYRIFVGEKQEAPSSTIESTLVPPLK